MPFIWLRRIGNGPCFGFDDIRAIIWQVESAHVGRPDNLEPVFVLLVVVPGGGKRNSVRSRGIPRHDPAIIEDLVFFYVDNLHSTAKPPEIDRHRLIHGDGE